MVPSSGIILIRRGSFVRALRGRARPGCARTGRTTTPSPGSQPGDTTTERVCVLFSAPERARSARGAPLQGAHNAEPGLSARGHDNGTRVRSLLRTLRGRARPGVRPYRAHTAPSPGSQPGITPATCGILFSEPGLSARGHDNGTRVSSLLRALRGRARPEVRPYRAHTTPSPGSQPGRHRRADPSRSPRTR